MITATQKVAQRNRGTLFVEDGEILATDAFAEDQYVQRIRAPRCAGAARPGTFVHLQCDAALPMRRPLSIMRAGRDWFEVLYKIVGQGLRLLADKRPGETVSILGPVGQPFRPSPQRPKALLIGGGVGIPPMVFLADALRRSPERWQPLALLGSEIPFPFDVVPSALPTPWLASEITGTMPLLESWGVPARLTTLAGYAGCYNGFVTDLANRWLSSLPDEDLEKTEIFACGPHPMLRVVAELALRYQVPCQVSLEEVMACAVGGCAGCAVEVTTPDGPAMHRVCVDGPVFDASTVVWK